MTITASKKSICIGILSLFWLYFLFIHRLGDRDLWNSHEARAAMNAQSMIDSGQWLLPQLYDGRWEVQKPPLYYWMVAGLAVLDGGKVNAWHVRLPSTLSALGCLCVLLWLGHRSGRFRLGIVAAIVLASAMHFTWLARVGRIDMPLTFSIALALACFYVRLHHDGSWRCLLVAYVALAAAVLLKGPIGLVLPGVVMFVHLALERRLRSNQLGLAWGIPLIATLTVPWFLLANQLTDGEFGHSFFWLHNVQRGFGGSRLRSHPWWRNGPQFALDFMPWSLLLIGLLWHHWQKRRVTLDPLANFGLTWLLSMLVLLSFARYKRPDYLVPAYPGAALCLGAFAHSILHSRLFQTALICIALGWWYRVDVHLPQLEPTRSHQAFAQEIHHRRYNKHVIFFRTEAHGLAFHVGRPLKILIDWNDLDRWPCESPALVVMPKDVAKDSANCLHHRFLVEIMDNSELIDGHHEQPLALFHLYTGF